MAEVRPVVLPVLHPRMDYAVLIGWLKREGDPVRRGEPLCMVEVRKVAFDVCSEWDGMIERRLVGDGARLKVGQELVLIRLTAEAQDRRATAW